LGVDPNLHCAQVYPVVGSLKPISSLKTVGIKLTPEQAAHLGQALLAASKEWSDIDITAYRAPNKSDAMHHLTVTSLR
jgi:hypothetical protein